jgi:hypothetical protein
MVKIEKMSDDEANELKAQRKLRGKFESLLSALNITNPTISINPKVSFSEHSIRITDGVSYREGYIRIYAQTNSIEIENKQRLEYALELANQFERITSEEWIIKKRYVE